MLQNEILIKKTSLFSFSECLWFLDRGYDDCLINIIGKEIRKAIIIEDQPILISIREDAENLILKILIGNMSEETKVALQNHLKEWFDLDNDIHPFYNLLQEEKPVAYMVEAFKGLRLISIDNLFEALCWSIIGQQINLTFAYKLKRRLIEAYGTKLTFEGNSYHIFPTPEALAKVTTDELKAFQFSTSKAKYVIGVAEAFAENKLNKKILSALPSIEARRKFLTTFNGIGDWTANYVLMKTMREPTAIPFGDVGLLKALEVHNIIDTRSELTKIKAFFNRFNGWESYLVFYLWRSLSQGAFQTR